jgi:proteasome activator subunit 4
MFRMSTISKQISREHTTRPVWYFAPPESNRLTEQDITDFVNCVKEYAFISIFNKDYVEKAAEACHYLSILRPELIVPVIVEKCDFSFFVR